MKIDVVFLPKDLTGVDLSDTVCIVLDIFRATTSIVTAIGNGCSRIIPVLSVEEGRTLVSQMGQGLLAGERQSIKIDGFHFGNSPFEFSQEKVQDQTIVMTTTNGTIAIKATAQAYATLIGAVINGTALCRQAMEYNKDIIIVCAGTDGLFSLEDALCAGLLVQLMSEQDAAITMTDGAQGALLMYKATGTSMVDVAMHSRNGKRLYDIGREQDVEYCFKQDISAVVPVYRRGEITELLKSKM